MTVDKGFHTLPIDYLIVIQPGIRKAHIKDTCLSLLTSICGVAKIAKIHLGFFSWKSVNTHKNLLSLFNESNIILYRGITYLYSFLFYFLMYSYPCETFFYPFKNIFMVGIQYLRMSIFGLILFFLFYLLYPLGYCL